MKKTKKIKWKKSNCDEPKNWKRVDVVDESINSSDSGAPQVDAGCSLIKKHTWHSAQRGRQSFRENFSGEKYYNWAPAAGFIDYWIFSSISEGDAYSFWATGHSSFHPKFFKNLATVPFLLKTLKGFHFFFFIIRFKLAAHHRRKLSKGRRFIDFIFSFFFGRYHIYIDHHRIDFLDPQSGLGPLGLLFYYFYYFPFLFGALRFSTALTRTDPSSSEGSMRAARNVTVVRWWISIFFWSCCFAAAAAGCRWWLWLLSVIIVIIIRRPASCQNATVYLGRANVSLRTWWR